MKWLGYKEVTVKSIRVDMPDIKRRMKTEHVEDLARDIRARGDQPIQAPTIRAKSNTLVCGRDRYSATLLNGSKKLWVHIVECDDREAQELELAENIYRRADNRAELLARLVQLQKQKIRAEEKVASCDTVTPSGTASKPPKSEQTVTSEARKAVARAAGVKPAAVRQAEERVAAKEAEKAAEAEEAEEVATQEIPQEALPEGFNAFDMDVAQASINEINLTVTRLRQWDQVLRRMLAHLTDAQKVGALISDAHGQKIRERLEAAGHVIRDAIPVSLCYFCKAQAGVAECPACGGTGVSGRHGGDNVPPELKTGGDKARVAVGGKFVLAGAAANAVAAAQQRPVKTIKVVKDDGTEVDLDSVGSEPGDDEQAFG